MIDLQIDEDQEPIEGSEAEKTPEKALESSYPADQVQTPADTIEEQEDDVRLPILSFLSSIFYLIHPMEALTMYFSSDLEFFDFWSM